jgi:hypothetical protein
MMDLFVELCIAHCKGYKGYMREAQYTCTYSTYCTCPHVLGYNLALSATERGSSSSLAWRQAEPEGTLYPASANES